MELPLLLLVIERSPETPMVSVSEALLLPGAGSGTVAAEATVAVLVTEPVAVARTMAVRVNVAVAPGERLTLVLILPLPAAWAQLPPLEAAQVHDAEVSCGGMASVTVAPLTVLGPLLRTVMV